MVRQSKKKILVPLDGSDRAMNTVRYIAKIDPFLHMHVVLFHVFNSVPEGYWDLEKDPRSTSTVRQVKSWELEQKKRIEQYMQIAEQYLLKAGFASERINIKIQKRKKGIARDIIGEARNGYEAVVTRRRGLTGLRGIVLGSVAAKLIEKLSFIPLILAGRKPPGHKILIAFDGSEGAWRAVDFVDRTLSGCDYDLNLINVIRGRENRNLESHQIHLPKNFSEITQKKMIAELGKARKKLIANGFQPQQVTTKLVTGVSSRAGAIVAEAKQKNYGTIVMGRRGQSKVRDFFIGRVTNKVIHIARDRTVWIIR
ncbi:MAG: universal stress protein [Desulfobacteraceae bacterium]|jgi:nucleotide-binding universal stress UspA family protein